MQNNNAIKNIFNPVLEKVLASKVLTFEDANILIDTKLTPLNKLMQTANTITHRHFGNEISMCVSLGNLTLNRAVQLKNAGVSRYHHNIEKQHKQYEYPLQDWCKGFHSGFFTALWMVSLIFVCKSFFGFHGTKYMTYRIEYSMKAYHNISLINGVYLLLKFYHGIFPIS